MTHSRPQTGRFGLVLILALAWTAGGCLKLQMSWKVYPDGSGMVKMRVIAHATGQSPEEMQRRLRSSSPFKEFNGIMIKPGSATSSIEDGNVHYYAEGYFTDINQVTHKGKPVMTFQKLDTGGYEAHYFADADRSKLGLGGKEAGDDANKGAAEAMAQMLKAMMKGFEIKVFVKMPADLTETNVEKKNERTAVLAITDKILDDKAEQERIEKLDGIRARCGEPNPDQQAEFAAFSKDLKQVLEDAAKKPEASEDGKFPDEEK